MISQDAKPQVEYQPKASSSEVANAVISFRLEGGLVEIISRYRDSRWIGNPIGSLAGSPVSERSIDFEKYGQLSMFAKAAIYPFYRHPLNTAASPVFATLIKKDQAIAKFFRFCTNESTGDLVLTKENTLRFFKAQAVAAAHIETLINIIGTIKGLAKYFERSVCPFDPHYPFPLSHGAQNIAARIWRETHNEDFDAGKAGHVPYESNELAAIVRTAYYYIDYIAPNVLEALRGCMDIADCYPERRGGENRSQEAKCGRLQKKFLLDFHWHADEASVPNWPPLNYTELLTQARLCSASLGISIAFATGGRSSEIVSPTRDALLKDKDGEFLLKMLQYKNEDSLNGVSRVLAVDKRIATGFRLLSDITDQCRRDEGVGIPPSSHLFMQTTSAVGKNRERLSRNGMTQLFALFKQKLLPGLDVGLNPQQFRSSVAPLITLSTEGASVTVPILLGHASLSYRVTLGYMYSSPLMIAAIAETNPLVATRNLRRLYQEREGLMGGAAASIRSAVSYDAAPGNISTEKDVGMTESEFVELGLEMMRSGQMTLSLIGAGKYCLKPYEAKAPCAEEKKPFTRDVGNCNPECIHHVIEGWQRPKMARTVIWLNQKINDEKSTPFQVEFYTGHLKTLKKLLSDGQ